VCGYTGTGRDEGEKENPWSPKKKTRPTTLGGFIKREGNQSKISDLPAFIAKSRLREGIGTDERTLKGTGKDRGEKRRRESPKDIPI